MIFYLFVALAAFTLSVLSTYLTRFLAKKLNIVDKPGGDRKIHLKNTPLLGGVAIFFVFFAMAYFLRADLLAGNLQAHHWLGVFFGALFIIIGGVLDDKYNLTPNKQIIWPLLAIGAVIIGGVGIEKISNPFGAGFIYLNQWQIPVLKIGGIIKHFIIPADIFTAIWLMGMMYTTKLLDGLDGLVTGVTAIGAFIIFLFTMTTKYYQPDVGLAALVLSSACFGFLVFNWNPASIFLGEGGSLFLGFILGVLSIISGGKIAVALLVMAIPIIDVVWTITRRLAAGRNPFKHADKKHLHFRLLEFGIGQRRTVLIYYLFALAFGLSALFMQSRGKILALFVLIILMIAVIGGFTYLDYKEKRR